MKISDEDLDKIILSLIPDYTETDLEEARPNLRAYFEVVWRITSRLVAEEAAGKKVETVKD